MAAPGTLIRAAPGRRRPLAAPRRCTYRGCPNVSEIAGRCWRHAPGAIIPDRVVCRELWGVASWGEYPHAQSEAPTRRERNHRR